MKVICAWGLTMAVCCKYSNTLCFPRTYLPLKTTSILVPCGRSQIIGVSFITLGSFFLVFMVRIISYATSSSLIFEIIRAGFPVVSCPYRTTALMPIPCCPLLCRIAWNLEPYSSLPKTSGMFFRTIPGPLSSTMIRYSSFPSCLISTNISGNICASSHASSELSTASLTLTTRAFVRESNPRICLFFSKNSATLISLCFLAIRWATPIFYPSTISFFAVS